MGNYNSLLTHFICRVIMILEYTSVWDNGYRYGYNDMGTGTSPACQESQVRVRDQVREYRYKLPYPDKYHDYGYE